MPLDDLLYIKRALGENGKQINVYKIRSMNQEGDVTRIGSFLRKYWIDELPQLYNFLKGDLRLIGVRPMSKEFWDRCPLDIKERALKEKPGIIGIGIQYSHREENFNEWVSTLRDYLQEKEEKSVLTDIKYFFTILFSTIFKGIRGF